MEPKTFQVQCCSAKKLELPVEDEEEKTGVCAVASKSVCMHPFTKARQTPRSLVWPPSPGASSAPGDSRGR